MFLNDTEYESALEMLTPVEEKTGTNAVNTWNVNPTLGVNGVPFGASRDTVIKKFGSPNNNFKKSSKSKNTTDNYGSFHIFYNTKNKMEAIEIFEGVVKVNGKVIFPNSIQNILNFDDSFEQNSTGCISKKLSIGIYMSNDKPESVLVGSEGYYG